MLFTRRFIKDLLWICVFTLCLYGMTHNPIIRPVPQPTPGNWSIQLMQHPLLFGFAGHNYLVLRDQDDTITEELHGLATDIQTGDWKYVGTNKTDILQVWEFNSPRYYLAEKKFPGIILSQGTQEQMTTIWNQARACKDPINQKKIPYPPFGVSFRAETVNSNSVANTLSVCMGLDIKHVGLLTPGEKRNLLAK